MGCKKDGGLALREGFWRHGVAEYIGLCYSVLDFVGPDPWARTYPPEAPVQPGNIATSKESPPDSAMRDASPWTLSSSTLPPFVPAKSPPASLDAGGPCTPPLTQVQTTTWRRPIPATPAPSLQSPLSVPLTVNLSKSAPAPSSPGSTKSSPQLVPLDRIRIKRFLHRLAMGEYRLADRKAQSIG